MGYAPLFDTLTKGTLCGRWPDIGLWPIVLSMADRHGVVDSTPTHIAAVTGLPIADVVACMTRFCQPDPSSRSQEHDGARLVLLDVSRDWGWQIVNYGRYREKARKASYDSARTASGLDAQRKRVSRDVPTSPALTRSQTETKTKTKEDTQRAREPVEVANEAEHHVMFERVRKAYPPRAGRQDWISAEHHCRIRIEQGATWNELVDAVKRYAKFVDSGGVSSTAYVLSPTQFFSAPDKPWSQAWELPTAKARATPLKPTFVAPPDEPEIVNAQR